MFTCFGYGSLVNADTLAPGTRTVRVRLTGWRRAWRHTGLTSFGRRCTLTVFSDPDCAIDGVVIARNVNAGQGVDAGGMLLEIADYSQVQIEGEPPESLVNGLGNTTNRAVRIRRSSDADGELIGVGLVRFVSPVIDPIKRTTHLIVEADNPQGLLRDGLYVNLTIVLREETSAVVVPVSAVVTDGPMHFVFVKDGEFYKKQDINPGYRDDRIVEVLEGVLPGDIIVTRGAYSLTQLRPKVETLADAAGENDSARSATDDAG